MSLTKDSMMSPTSVSLFLSLSVSTTEYLRNAHHIRFKRRDASPSTPSRSQHEDKKAEEPRKCGGKGYMPRRFPSTSFETKCAQESVKSLLII